MVKDNRKELEVLKVDLLIQLLSRFVVKHHELLLVSHCKRSLRVLLVHHFVRVQEMVVGVDPPAFLHY